jgi:hypothetical protein
VRVSVWLGLVAVVVACGGRVNPEGDAGSSSGVSSGSSGSSPSSGSSGSAGEAGSGSSSGVTVPLCPLAPPTVGTACPGPGTQGCVYLEGSGCHAFICDDSGTWQTTTTGC